jgi:hypothetical protein
MMNALDTLAECGSTRTEFSVGAAGEHVGRARYGLVRNGHDAEAVLIERAHDAGRLVAQRPHSV